MPTPDLILLAGGAGSRMGGDKLLLRDRDGRLLALRWFERLGRRAPPRLVLPPGGVAPAELADWPKAFDAVGGEGPLRGVEAALAATAAEWLLVVAVDTPGVGRTQLDWLADRRDTEPAARLWMTRRAMPDGGPQIEPFPLLVHREMSPAVAARLAVGRRSLHGLADEPGARVVDAPGEWPADVWRNLNRPADLEAYLSGIV